jgi:hypothetical protein
MGGKPLAAMKNLDAVYLQLHRHFPADIERRHRIPVVVDPDRGIGIDLARSDLQVAEGNFRQRKEVSRLRLE